MQKKVLVVVANPKGTSNLNLLPEIRDLQESLLRSQQRHSFSVEWRVAKTHKDLRRYILDIKPHIIHFCGHGTEQGLVLEDETGTAKVVSNEVLTSLLQTFADSIECVLLNACYSEPLSDSLAQHLNVVIGMNQAVNDDAAIAFAEGFYDALGSRESYQRAFDVGKNAVLGQVTNRSGVSREITVIDENSEPVSAQSQEHLIPVLKINPNPRCLKPLGQKLKLEDRKSKLAKERKRLEAIDQKIAEGVDFEEEEKLENRKNGIYQKINALSQEIRELKIKLEKQLLEDRGSKLLRLLQADDSAENDFQQAYQAVVSHWSIATPPAVTSLSEMLTELDRMGNNDAGYSALESFIAHLWHKASPELLVDLRLWGKVYSPERNWADLYTQIQAELTAKAANFKPAILINICLAEEKTTQSGNQPHYRLEAWLVENLETYQEQGEHRTGYHPLTLTGTPATEPFVIEALEAKIQPLLNNWISQTKQLLVNCNRDPKFYVFLPKSLLEMAVDYWPLDKRKRLGHLYSVVLCCSDRLDGPYPVEAWHRFWERHCACSEKTAKDAFIEGSDENIDDLIEALEEAEDDENIVGLKLKTAPSPEKFEMLFDELLVAGLPTAFWGRCDKVNILNAEELDTILQKASLGRLSGTVQHKRREARKVKNTPECHIGHHLSLLQDNPKLIPPWSD